VARVDVGDIAPDFDLPVTGGGSYRLSDHRGRWVVLAFYPGDFTAVCTRQFCSYRDRADDLALLAAELVGISSQSIDSHERFVDQHDLTVPLLADADRRAIDAYGVAGPGGLTRRSVFIIDPQGVVRHRHVALLGLRYRDADQLERALKDARSDYAPA
jgi:thioredoxin-dependent peroxiredoxin